MQHDFLCDLRNYCGIRIKIECIKSVTSLIYDILLKWYLGEH